ncbi:ABC-2 family transporter [Motilibacter rhizosphaerae]|uniref:ABC-2 family transporter n=1 Tax=Motilibacter rhizosphaerae TaxID=598652 RepID=A0A4Q7NBF4_9ACTN|nr:ABC transporter permease subunit [Motilibacter rhizosphaerae]RZS80160.1 ABC-2 family transporter [Motilibacter rhizosphaerae]
MTWLTWRQARLSLCSVAAAAAVVVVLLVLTRPGLMDAYALQHSTFLDRLQSVRSDQSLYLAGIVALYLVPPVIGGFWGAPLVARELEAGTHRLVWTQGVTRTRWLAVKLAVTGGTALAVTAVLAVVVQWWSSPIDLSVDRGHAAGPFSLPRISPELFSARGVVPVAYAALALVLGVAVGLVLRRTVPAIGLTLVLVAAVQVVMPTLVREHLARPQVSSIPLTLTDVDGLRGRGPDVVDSYIVRTPTAGSWTLSDATAGPGGTHLQRLPASANCFPTPPDPGSPPPTTRPSRADMQACFARITAEGYRQRIVAFRAGSFWTLQWRETGLLSGTSLLLLGFSFWRVRRDLT